MGLYDKYLPASFRGVPFLVTGESSSGGKKNVIHEYPNSNRRFVEEFGKLLPTYTFDAIVHGQDCLNQRIRLERALDEEGRGLLVHPDYGEVMVTSLTHTSRTSRTEQGKVDFTLTFAVSDEETSPEPYVAGPEAVTVAAANARAAIDANLETIYIPPTTSYNYSSVLDKTVELWGSLQETVQGVAMATAEKAAQFNRISTAFISNAFSVIVSAADMKDAVNYIVDSALEIVETPDLMLSAWKSIASQLPLPIGDVITAKQIERVKSETVLSEHQSLTGLINLYEATVYTDYTTDEAIEKAKIVLEDFYTEKVIHTPETLAENDLTSVVDPETMAALRDTARKVLEEKAKTAYRVIEIERPGRLSMSLAAFKYYNSLDLVDDLATLNEELSSSLFSATMKILTDAAN